MRAVELKESVKIGREYQHLEDLVFAEGSAGAVRAVEYLTAISKDSNPQDFTLKWDGNPTVYWGREPDGTFVFVGKNNWDKADQGGLCTSPEELKSFILSRGKGEDWREQFANDLAELWHIFEAGTPEAFRGYFYGDLLFHPGKPYDVDRQELVFEPNKVEYRVPIDEELGLMLFRAKSAVVAHKYFKRFGDKDTAKTPKFTQFKTCNFNYFPSASMQLAILGTFHPDQGVELDASEINKIKTNFLNKAVLKSIDEFLTPVKGLSRAGADIYTFHNAQSRTGNLKGLAQHFMPWAKANLGPVKLAAFQAKIEQNEVGFAAMFALIEEIRTIKNAVIDQLDTNTSQLKSSTNGVPGGEGWIYKDTKFVPRHRWTPN